MSDLSGLEQRIDSAIAAAREKIRQQNKELLQDHADRQRRLQRFEKARDQVRAIARPRLEALARRFGDQVRIRPLITQTRAAATLEFQSTDAWITLTFSVVPDQAVQSVVVEYDLDVTPVLTMFESHAEFRAPIDGLNPAELESWLDEWIVKFIEFYVRMHETEAFGRAEYVEDPVVRVKFPRFAAGATLEHDGKTYYFLDERTRGDFARQQGIALS